VSDSTTAVAHEHIAVDKSDGVASGVRYSILHNRTTDHLLVHIVILPVVGWRIVPLADRAVKRVLHIPMIEAGDEVGAADDVLRIKEPKCTLLVVRDKLDTVQPFCFPPRPMFLVDVEPADPENIHVRQFGHSRMENFDSVDPEDTCINVGMGRVAMRKRDHVWAASRIDLVHPSPEVIRGVIDAHRAPLLKAIASDVDPVAIVVREGGEFWIVLAVKDASEEVVCQFWDKVLVSGSVRCVIGMCRSAYLHSWIVCMLTQHPFVKPQVSVAPFGH